MFLYFLYLYFHLFLHLFFVFIFICSISCFMFFICSASSFPAPHNPHLTSLSPSLVLEVTPFFTSSSFASCLAAPHNHRQSFTINHLLHKTPPSSLATLFSASSMLEETLFIHLSPHFFLFWPIRLTCPLHPRFPVTTQIRFSLPALVRVSSDVFHNLFVLRCCSIWQDPHFVLLLFSEAHVSFPVS